MIKVCLLFPPTWSLNTGSPHLALPLLSGYLQQHGYEVTIRDLNWEIARYWDVFLSAKAALEACSPPTLENMNIPYFAAEDKLMGIARRYSGTWNAQLGFEYDRYSHASSRQALMGASLDSPFTEYYDRYIIPELNRLQPDIVGFCLASVYQIIPTLQLCYRLRKAGYVGFIVLGGNTVSRLAKEMQIPQLFRLVDALVVFQGEKPLLRLCEALQNGRCLEAVPQLIWWDGQTVRVNEHHEPLNPNEVPTPDYSDLPVGHYWGVNYINLLAVRGCYYGKCTFCAIPYGWGNNGYAGQRQVELVYQDMLTLMERHGIYRFKFIDEALPVPLMRRLAEMIRADGVQVEWEAYTRLERAWFDIEFVELVASAGFRKGYFGLEIIPSSRRSALNKRDQPDPLRLLENCHRAGVKVHFFCMFGFPGTSREDAEATVQFLLKHQDLIDTVDIFPWTYAKHTIVHGVEPVIEPEHDWALEYAYRATAAGALDSQEVVSLASAHEELLWREVPRFLHPTYRLVSPWSVSLPSPTAPTSPSHTARARIKDKSGNICGEFLV